MTEPATPRRWRAQPLFISSTFRDMQAERKEQLVRRVCFHGVVECRPYVMIVLLGDRDGWRPPPDRLAEIAAERGFSREAAVCHPSLAKGPSLLQRLLTNIGTRVCRECALVIRRWR